MQLIHTGIQYFKAPFGKLKCTVFNGAVSELKFVEESEIIPESVADCKDLQVLDECRRQLKEYFFGKRFQFSIPIQQEGTPFQQLVWQLLMKIPFGKTISYGDLAKQLSDPKKVRAVANANGKNHIAIIVPCHRVIGSNGDLTGYAGGLKNKQWLLDHESKFARGVQRLFD